MGNTSVASVQSDQIIARLSEIWRDILRLPEVSATDNFFAVGGDSLAAIRVTQKIEVQFGLALPVHAIFESPTLQRLASRIELLLARAGPQDQHSPVLPMAQSENGFPLFFNEVDMRLAKSGAWTAACPLYSISHWAQGEAFVHSRSLAELAGTQLAAVRKVQPRGPYRIAGFSFGGLVAYEMAQQLRREGQDVELLFLIDPVMPGHTHEEISVIPLGLLDNPIGRWWLYKKHHPRAPSAASIGLLPMRRRPAFWFTTLKLTAGYRIAPYAGTIDAMFSDDARRIAWQPMLGPNARIGRIELSGAGVFDDPALATWMTELNRRIDALDSADLDGSFAR